MLLELLVVLAVAALLFALGVPSFLHTIANADRTAAVNAFVTAIHLAHSAAHTRGEDVVLCKAPGDGHDCERSEAVPWQTGALVFVNLDNDDPPRVDDDEPVLLHQTVRRPVQIRANRAAFVFRPFDRRATNGSVVFCDHRGSAYARVLIVSYTGRPRVSATMPDGSPPSCESA
jgi:type IV fimbrial biogenesis protein FimT